MSIARLEGKVDTLTVKVDAGDRGTAALVDVVKTEMAGLRASFEDFRTLTGGEITRTDHAISKVRTDLTGELEGQQKSIDRLAGWVNRLIGGVLLAGGIGVAGVVAAFKGWS